MAKNKGASQRRMEPTEQHQGLLDAFAGQIGSLMGQLPPSSPRMRRDVDLVAGQDPLSLQAAAGARGLVQDASGFQRGLGGLVSGLMGEQRPDLAGAYGTANQAMAGLPLAQQTLGGIAGQEGVGQMMGMAQQRSPFDAAIAQAATGQLNPAVGEAYRQAAGDLSEQFNEQVLPNIAAQFTGAGRTGGGLQARALTDAAGELADAQSGLASRMFSSAAENAAARQLAAGQAGSGLDLSRFGQAANLFNQGAGRALQAGQSLQGGALAGMSGLGDLFNTVAGRQLGAGNLGLMGEQGQRQNLQLLNMFGEQGRGIAQNQIDADMRRDLFNQNAPLRDWQNRLGGLGQLAGMTGNLFNPTIGQSGKQMGMNFDPMGKMLSAGM